MGKKSDNRKLVMGLYRDKSIANNYGSVRFKTILGETIDKSEEKILSEFFKSKGEASVLEIACGTGRITRNIRPKKIVAIDTSKEMLSIAKKNKELKRVIFIIGNAFSLPLNEKFDVVVSFRLFRHFNTEEQRRAFEEITRVLKKDGLFLFDVLNKDRSRLAKFLERTFLFGRTLKCRIKNKPLKIVYDEYFTSNEIKELLDENGFSILKRYPVCKRYNLLFFLHFIQKIFVGDLPVPIKETLLKMEMHRKEKVKGNLQWLIIAKRR